MRGRSVDLLLVGFGHVGRRFVTLLNEIGARLEADEGLTWRVVGIVTRTHGAALDPAGMDVGRALAVAERAGSVDLLHDSRQGAPPQNGVAAIRRAAAARDPARHFVVVETTVLDITSGQPAIDHVRAAIGCGAHVITANKGPAAFAYRELTSLAASAGVAFRFEGAVMDGIPIFNLVRELLPAVQVVGFRGIVNSTTNWILTAMEDGTDAEAALREMEAAGVAEADTSLDLDGWDAAAKTAALANVLLGADITPHAVARRGIRGLSRDAVRQALSRRSCIRLIASGRRTDGTLQTSVEPRELPADDLLGRLRGMANALILETDLLGDVMIAELSGGLTQTAYALVTDLVGVTASVPPAMPPRRSLSPPARR